MTATTPVTDGKDKAACCVYLVAAEHQPVRTPAAHCWLGQRCRHQNRCEPLHLPDRFAEHTVAERTAASNPA